MVCRGLVQNVRRTFLTEGPSNTVKPKELKQVRPQ